jgi:hypothetical protein
MRGIAHIRPPPIRVEKCEGILQVFREKVQGRHIPKISMQGTCNRNRHGFMMDPVESPGFFGSYQRVKKKEFIYLRRKILIAGFRQGFYLRG